MDYRADKMTRRGIYAFVYQDKIVYVGSTACGLTRLEQNHRNASERDGYSMTHFRKELTKTYKGVGSFRWLVEPFYCDQREIETFEREHIKAHSPLCNIDKDPVRSSRRHGRY